MTAAIRPDRLLGAGWRLARVGATRGGGRDHLYLRPPRTDNAIRRLVTLCGMQITSHKRVAGRPLCVRCEAYRKDRLYGLKVDPDDG